MMDLVLLNFIDNYNRSYNWIFGFLDFKVNAI